jgi:hypothetical protein
VTGPVVGISGDTCVEVVTRLFAAAHWQIGESDYVTYEEALEDLANDDGTLDVVALAAAKEMVAKVDPSEHRYSPAVLRSTVLAIRRRQAALLLALAEDTSLPADEATRAAALAEIRATLAQTKGPLERNLRRVLVRTPNEPDFES